VIHVREGGDAHAMADVPLVLGELLLRAISGGHKALGVADAGGGTVQHGDVELLGDIEGGLHEVQAFLAVGGLHHGYLRGLGIVTVVLLVLAGVHGGIIGGDHHVALAHAVIRGGEHGVGGHVQAHMLHGAQRAGAGHGRTVGHLGGDLLVGGPFAVQ